MKGQSLIEVVVSLGIITLVITGVAQVVTSSLKNAEAGKYQDAATKYAQDGLEVTRSIRNNDYASFATLNGSYCLAKNATTFGSTCTTPNVDQFIRVITIASSGCSPNVSQVTATVSWTDSKCSQNAYCHKSQLVTCLSVVNPNAIP